MYPAAARFFESLRLLEHKPKSAKRLKAEAAFGRFGRATCTISRTFRCPPDYYPVQDEVGRVRTVYMPNRGRIC